MKPCSVLPLFAAAALWQSFAVPVRAAEPLVAVLYGELSVKASDRGYSRAMARNMERWLDDAGLTPVSFPDSKAAAAFAAPRRVAAWWEDRNGHRTPYACWLQHANGFWMTHVLVEDEDGDSRRRLLTAISAACAAPVWRDASDTLLARLGTLFGAQDYASAVRLLRSKCPPSRHPAFDALAQEMDKVFAGILLDRKRGLHAPATAKLWQLRGLLIEAHATIQLPWPKSVRAVWDHEGLGLFLGNWEATCATLARYGVTDLYLLVATPSTTHAQVPGLTPTALRRDHGDQLAQALPAARRHGLRLHAWIIALSAGDVEPRLRAEYGAAGRLLVDRDGTQRNWLDPRNAENRARIRETVAHLATQYAVDGIHLDYIRYPDFSSSLGTPTRAAFERRTQNPVEIWPRDVQYPARPRYKEFVAYRAEGITAIVADARQVLKAKAPKALLTAAVYGRYPLCVESVGQDWMAWLRDGLLDYAAPMNYASSMAQYSTYLDDQSRVPELRRRILTGIGVTAAESSISAVQVIDQLDAARDRGFGGYALFDLDATLRLEVLPMLRLGINGR
jgi:uncharacterized lipoprotein YddW (UPF0748 family)